MPQLTTTPCCPTATGPTPRGLVEPLALPEPGTRPDPCPGGGRQRPPRCGQFLETDLGLIRAAAGGARPVALLAPEDPRRRARYRWAVGHHAAFAVWQQLRHALESTLTGPEPPTAAIRAAAGLYDLYSVLFLYAGSCSAQQYAATVRPDMTDHHPAFSGEWAPDHEAIPSLLKRVRAALPDTAALPLTGAVRLNHRIHMSVARKLVPDGASLLQQAGRPPGRGPSPAERDLYDAYFAVRRQRVCTSAFASQLVRRLAQVLCDIAVHGLPGSPARPGHAEDIEALRLRAPELLRRLAEDTAAGLPPRTEGLL
ncbi:hypothetical protein ACIQPR_02980 [Streptomyces sp. NPDC091280]|uniref:hypothetical protein n=1 Tax=Streptomyces sp. NPDC091280 TaxID=3365984 RepID=UPI003803DC0C